jgi:hypothetical protein
MLHAQLYKKASFGRFRRPWIVPPLRFRHRKQ